MILYGMVILVKYAMLMKKVIVLILIIIIYLIHILNVGILKIKNHVMMVVFGMVQNVKIL